MALLVLIHNKDKRIIKILAVISLLGIISTFNCYQAWVNQRAALAQNTDAIVEESECLKNIIQITDTGNPWDNTVAHYGSVDYRYLSLPVGFGGNYMIGGGVNEKAKYALISRGDKNEEAIRQMLADSGHRVILEDDWFVVLINDQI